MIEQRYRRRTRTALCCIVVVLTLTTGVGSAAAASGTPDGQTNETTDVAAEFGNGGVTTVGQGGIATVPITLTGTETATVNVGFNDVNFNLTFDVVDGNGDGQVRARINTFRVGQPDFVASVNETTAASVTAVTENDTIRNASVLGLGGDPGIPGPLDPSHYDMNLTHGGDELDVGTLQIVEPSLSTESWTLPRNRSDSLATASDVQSAISNDSLTEDNSIARGDTLVLRANGSAWTGMFATAADTDGEPAYTQAFGDFARDDAWTAGVRDSYQFGFSLESANGGQQLDVTESLDRDALRVVPDFDDATLYVIADSDDLVLAGESDTLETGTYETNLTVDLSPGNDGIDAARDEFSVEDRQVAFDETAVSFENASAQTVTGTASVAPGTSLQVRLGGDEGLQRTTTAVVQPDGRFEASFDLSDVTSNASVEITATDVASEQLDGTVAAVANESSGSSEMDGTDGTAEPTAGTDSTDDVGTTSTSSETTDAPTTTGSTGPGFSVVLAVLAVLGTVVLARRRAH